MMEELSLPFSINQRMKALYQCDYNILFRKGKDRGAADLGFVRSVPALSYSSLFDRELIEVLFDKIRSVG